MTGKKKTIYATVIGLGLAGLAIDQISSDRGPGTPASALAGGPHARVPVSQPSSQDQSIITVAVRDFPIDDLLLENSIEFRNPFAMSDTVIDRISVSELQADVGEEFTTESSPAQSLESSHILSAVLMVDGSRKAIVDGSLLVEGDSLDDCTLTKIDQRQIIFDCSDRQATLMLLDPLANQ